MDKAISYKDWLKAKKELKHQWKNRKRLKLGCLHSYIESPDIPIEISEFIKRKHGVELLTYELGFYLFTGPGYKHELLKCIKCSGYKLRHISED